jgi:membrane protein DedA with SNARE-associated domain
MVRRRVEGARLTMFDQLTDGFVEFMQKHAAWTIPATFIIAFAESLAVVSLFVPATVMLLGIGALVSAGVVGFWEVFAAGVAGAILGNVISYWIGYRFKHSIEGSWFFRKRPELLQRGHDFFERHGGKSVFLGRFFGPTRAVVPLIAGMTAMPRRRFLAANVLSALIWVVLSISPGLVTSVFPFDLSDKPAQATTPAPVDPSVPSVPLR